MLTRYTRPAMGAIWTEEHKFRTWLKVELAVCQVQCERGLISPADYQTIATRADFDLERITAIEAEVQHDVIAFLTSVAEKVGPASRLIHQGLTSSDLLDTALALQLQAAGELLKQGLRALIELTLDKAREYKDLLMIGRTHGVHAEPITFGLKFLLWHTELQRQLHRLEMALEDVQVGKFSGAVGTYQHIDPEVEAAVCHALGLQPAPVSNQIVQRDRHAFFVTCLALIGATLEKIATEIRHLQRTEVLEAEEPFGRGQKGSSAMPHKRNPVKAERLCGLARLLRGYQVTAMENVTLWHERDISHSSAERVILSDACIVLDFMLADLHGLLSGLQVYPERIRQNLELTRGLIFSQEVLLALTAHGLTREQAYAIVQDDAQQVWNGARSFREVLLSDERLRPYLTPEEIEAFFDYTKVQARINQIFKRFEVQ